MTEDIATALIYALFGTGGVTFIWTVVRSILAWRASAELREDKAVARLEIFESRCRDDLDRERKMCNYWCQWAGTLEYRMRQAGVEVPERPAEPKDNR